MTEIVNESEGLPADASRRGESVEVEDQAEVEVEEEQCK